MIQFKFADSHLLRSFFRDILTGKDGTSYDLGRVLGAFGFIGYMLFGTVQSAQIFLAPEYHEFPFASFGAGFTAIAAGAGAMIWMKKDTEPTPEPPK